MARLVSILAAVALSGCFTSWTGIQLAGVPQALDESIRESKVPQPGVREQLRVRMPLILERDLPQQTPGVAPTPAVVRPFALGCQVTQQGRDTVYRSAYRYGKKWKYSVVTMFLLEAAVASVFYLSKDRSDIDPGTSQGYLLASGFLAVDAVGTAALFFAPRKEIYRSDVRPVTTDVRTDCPDGLALDVGGEVFPVDAAGRIGELGDAALDGWMTAPTAPLRLTYAGTSRDLMVGSIEQCTWRQQHHPEQQPANCSGYGAQNDVYAILDVPMGTLTRAEAIAPTESVQTIQAP